MLFTPSLQRVLGLMFGRPDREFAVRELIDLVGSGSGSVQRVLQRLLAAELVHSVSIGRRRLLKANRASPLFDELRGLIVKTVGLVDPIRDALHALEAEIDLALVFGSVAKHRETASSDIDVLIVSDTLLLEDVFRVLHPVEARLGRPIAPVLYTRDAFDQRRRDRHPFLTNVLEGDHIMLLGNLDGTPETREPRDDRSAEGGSTVGDRVRGTRTIGQVPPGGREELDDHDR